MMDRRSFLVVSTGAVAAVAVGPMAPAIQTGAVDMPESAMSASEFEALLRRQLDILFERHRADVDALQRQLAARLA